MKNVWILNHYATDMFINKGGRHFWFAENLINSGFSTTVFCASTCHNSDRQVVVEKGKYVSRETGEIPFVFIKTPQYCDNGVKRIWNMVSFYRNLFPVSWEYARLHGKPDVILASSVHPLTLLAGIKIARRFEVPCICEIRDLWPESIVAYGLLKRKNLLVKLFYKGEKWIYKKSDAIVMTWQGGADYIVEQKWDNCIDISKVTHISNGVDLRAFDNNCRECRIADTELFDTRYKNIVYAGSIRHVNDLGMLIDAAKIIKNRGVDNIRFLVYGDGNDKENLVRRCNEENIDNVSFKGRVEKRIIPSILSKAYINILHNKSTTLDKYGQSQNKFFEYLAAGRCIIQTYTTGYNILRDHYCGFYASEQTPEEIAKVVIDTCNRDKDVEAMGNNARTLANEYDYSVLTEKLVALIANLLELQGEEL